MKKMNKLYEAPKAELINLDVNKDFMMGGGAGSVLDPNPGGEWS